MIEVKNGELLSRKEVCTQLKVSYLTLERYRKKGILQGYSVGARVKYLKNEVEDLLNPKPLSV